MYILYALGSNDYQPAGISDQINFSNKIIKRFFSSGLKWLCQVAGNNII